MTELTEISDINWNGERIFALMSQIKNLDDTRMASLREQYLQYIPIVLRDDSYNVICCDKYGYCLTRDKKAVPAWKLLNENASKTERPLFFKGQMLMPHSNNGVIYQYTAMPHEEYSAVFTIEKQMESTFDQVVDYRLMRVFGKTKNLQESHHMAFEKAMNQYYENITHLGWFDMGIIIEDTPIEQKKIQWDRKDIGDLISILRRDPDLKIFLEEEHPVPSNVSSIFPFVTAIDECGQCLLSLADYSVEQLSELIIKRDMQNVNAQHIEFCYPSYSENGRPFIFNAFPLKAVWAINEDRFAFVDELRDKTFIYYKEDIREHNGLPDPFEPISWKILSVKNKPVHGVSANLEKALVESHQSGAANIQF